MREKNIITAIDLGASAVRVLIARVTPKGLFEVLAFQEEFVRTLSEGMIVDLSFTSDILEDLLIKAEEQANMQVEKVVVNVGGENVYSTSHFSNFAIKHSSRRIRRIDLHRAIYKKNNFSIPEGFNVLHTHVNDFVVDDVSGIKEPLGMVANKLKVDLQVFLCKSCLVENVTQLFDSKGIPIEAIFSNAFAVGEGTLLKDEKAVGVIALDVGDLSSDVIFYHKNKLVKAFSLNFGYDAVTDHLAHNLGVTKKEAKIIKQEYAHVGNMQKVSGENVSSRQMLETQNVAISQGEISSLIEEKLKDFFEKMEISFQREGLKKELASVGIILTGGMANLSGIVQAFKEYFRMPVSVRSGHYLMDDPQKYLKGYEYSLSVGLVNACQNQRMNKHIKNPQFLEKLRSGIENFFSDFL